MTTADLAWFYRLPLSLQSALLRDPTQTLDGEMARRLFVAREAIGIHWLANEGGANWELHPSAALELKAFRAQLDRWWRNLSPEQQAHFIEKRAEELDDRYLSVVRCASGNPDCAGPDRHVVAVVTDRKTQRFRLPPMIRTYVEMKAADAVLPSQE